MPAALAAHGAFVVNEAYSLVQGWAEGSLQAADAILSEHFGLARPWDFAASEYPVHVAQTAKAACEAATATVPNGTSGGDSGAYDDDALCFEWPSHARFLAPVAALRGPSSAAVAAHLCQLRSHPSSRC